MSHLHMNNAARTEWGTMGLGWGALLRLPAVWRTRLEQRRHLASLDAHLLEDMGMDRESAAREADKPFWAA